MAKSKSATTKWRTLSAPSSWAARVGCSLISWGDEEASAVIYSLMETAKANGLRLEDYILHLLSILPEHFEADPNADIDDLLPWHNGIRDSFATL